MRLRGTRHLVVVLSTQVNRRFRKLTDATAQLHADLRNVGFHADHSVIFPFDAMTYKIIKT
jgi:hypothetical protein